MKTGFSRLNPFIRGPKDGTLDRKRPYRRTCPFYACGSLSVAKTDFRKLEPAVCGSRRPSISQDNGNARFCQGKPLE